MYYDIDVPSQSCTICKWALYIYINIYIILKQYIYKYFKTLKQQGSSATEMLHIEDQWLEDGLSHAFLSGTMSLLGSSRTHTDTHTHERAYTFLVSHWISVGSYKCFYIIFSVLHQELRSCVVETHPRRLVRWDAWFKAHKCFFCLEVQPNYL